MKKNNYEKDEEDDDEDTYCDNPVINKATHVGARLGGGFKYSSELKTLN